MGGAVTQVQIGYGGHWASPSAAKSITRICRQIGHDLQITELGRTWDQQNKHYQTYLRDGWPIALSPNAPSIHQLGNAMDSNEAQRMVAVMEDHGWRRTVYRGGKLVEPWHFEYFAHLDNHIHEVVELVNDNGTWRVASAAVPVPEIKEKDEMKIISNGEGAQRFADEFGSEDIGNYFYVPNGPTGTPSWVDNIHAAWLLAGEPEEGKGWLFELARHQANARWDVKRGEIVGDVVKALSPLLQALGQQIAGLSPESIGKLIQAGLDNVVVKAEPISEADRAAIAATVVDLQAKRLTD